jgi:plasmid maintenance system antidote protein VapI
MKTISLQEYIQTTPKMSMNKLAKLVPCSTAYIHHIINGKRVPSYKMAKRLEQVTEFKVSRENWYK